MGIDWAGRRGYKEVGRAAYPEEMSLSLSRPTQLVVLRADLQKAADREQNNKPKPARDSQPATPETPLVGKTVMVHGLERQPKLNGAFGRAQRSDLTTGRYIVLLDGRRAAVKLKPSNLKEVPPGARLPKPPVEQSKTPVDQVD